jgi:hypothetical protein
MPVAAALGDKLVGLAELNGLTDSNVAAIKGHVDEELINESFSLELPGGSKIGASELAMARDAKSETTPFVGIGLGKPLTVTIETVYLGDYPDALWWAPGFNEDDVLVTSAHKPFQTFAGAPRAVHLLQPRAKRKSLVRANAVGQGSQLVYYSPATVDFSVLFTVELSADRELNAAIGESFGKAVAAAGSLPVFATAAPFLVAAERPSRSPQAPQTSSLDRSRSSPKPSRSASSARVSRSHSRAPWSSTRKATAGR